MALNFPTSPSLNQIYDRWMWNGDRWVAAPAPPATAYLPLHGGTMSGPILQPIPPATAAAVPNRQYVDEAVATQALYQGVWTAATNDPDLSAAATHRDGYMWLVTTPDPNLPFTVTATGIAGLSGNEVHNGDRVIWSVAAAEFQIVPGGGLTMTQGDARYLQLIGGALTGPGDLTVGGTLDVTGATALAGTLTLAASPLTDMEAATKKYVDDRAGGRKTATVVVGNAALHSALEVDFLCDGTDDVAQIQAAIDALPAAGGKIVIREGNYNLDNPINVRTKTEIFIEGMGDVTNFNLLDMPTANNTQGWFEITTSAIFEHFHCTFTNQTQTDLARVMAVFHVSGGMFARFNYINFTGRNLAVNVSYVFRNININDWAWGVRNDWTVFEVFKCNLDFDNVANHILGAATIGVIGYFYIVYPPNPNVAVRRGVRGALKECVCKVKNNNQTTGSFRLAMNYSFNTWIENNFLDIDRTSTSLISIGGGNPSFETHTVGNTIMCNEMYDLNADNIIGWGSGASVRHGHFMNNYIVIANMYNCSGGLVYMNGGLWARDNFIHVTVRTIGSRGAMNVFMTAGTYSGSTFDNNRIIITRDDTTEPTVFPRSLFTSTNQSWATVQNVTIINNMINYSDVDPWYLWSDRSGSGFMQLIEPGGPGVQEKILPWNRSGLFAFTRF